MTLEDSEINEGVMHNLIPCSTSADEVQVVDVEMQMLSFWEKTEVYLKMISVPLIIVAVTVIGFLFHFFKEIIIPTILALFLFQVSFVLSFLLLLQPLQLKSRYHGDKTLLHESAADVLLPKKQSVLPDFLLT